MLVFQERAPFTKSQIRCDERGPRLVPLLHERKEQPHLRRFDFGIAHFIDDQAVVLGILAQHFCFRVVGERRV